MVLVAIMLFLPLVSFLSIRWIKKNNRFSRQEDIRNKESAVLIKMVIVSTIAMVAGLGVLLFLGLHQNTTNIAVAIIQIATFAIKLLAMNFVFVWVRWTLPRFRYDQLQDLGWRVLMPLAIANIVITAFVVVVFKV